MAQGRMVRLENGQETTMKAPLAAAIFTALGMMTLAPPAYACSAGYEAVWIQGNKVCKIKTPKLGLKANTGPTLKKNATFSARTAAPARRAR
jgi:hypothetical protein